MGFGFDLEEFMEYRQELLETSRRFPTLRKNCLTRIGYAVKRKTVPFIPRDTGNLRASLDSKVASEDRVEIGTDVEYAQAVNDGHIQRKRFLPAKYLSRSVKGRKYLKSGNTGGIMLKPKFIPGVHFMEKGLLHSESDINREINKMLEEVNKKL